MPSPQLITVLVRAFCGSLQLAVAVTFSGTVPLLGVTARVQVGGLWVDVAVVVTVWEAEPVKLALSVAVTFTVKVPALA